MAASDEKLSIIGRERSLIDKLTKQVHKAVGREGHWTTDLRNGRRDGHFDVQIRLDGEPTGHIARVTVELDRYEEPGKDA